MDIKEPRPVPPEYAFLSEVMKEIAFDNYEKAILLLVEGFRQFVISSPPTSKENFEYAFAPVPGFLEFKREGLPKEVELSATMTCGFCWKQVPDGELIAGACAAICWDCVKLCNQVIESKK